MLELIIPRNWRKGQTLFNFLEWLQEEKEIHTNQSQRLADTFHVDDKEMDKYIKEYNKLNK